MRSSIPQTAIVIGSGIVGAAIAYFLTRRGIRVQLLEASAPAAEATGAADGAVSVASKRPGPMMVAAIAGVALYRELEHEGLFAGLFKSRSTFIVATSDEECAVLEAHADALEQAGVRIERLTGGALFEVLPALSPSTRLAVQVHGEGHAIGYQIVHRLLTAAGIVVDRHTPVNALLRDANGRALGVETHKGQIKADVVVIAAGTGSATLLGLADILIPRKGQLLVTERAPRLNAAFAGSIMSGRYLMSKGNRKPGAPTPARGLGLVIDPLVTGQFLIGGTREDHGDRRTNDIGAVSQILADAVALVPQLVHVRLLRSFAGNRTAVLDGLPLIGRVPGLDNAFVATGFEGDGICLGPIVGRTVAELVCGEAPSIDLVPFDPARFKSGMVAA
ncbi:glycine/D-amino acid oxidase-like deaminating enzyme [Rhizobium petrolearium]|uniref:NAD(P)/FAD-dependent oxidoreductase n=1 Tax=Neorhizobium petrolearium TaxID=515361 RepID=UPI001AE83AD2|nr:FAD-binding oxidoreductase [Neorhizobium petrolearium]MBP1843340.1 glycine/D-amino acid oxidase-like deaminating enzyme [Neorhizobium petrolearium]